jgi:hypothetical protein
VGVGVPKPVSIYVCGELIKYFANEILPHINVSFVLVSGDSDLAVPYEVISKDKFQHLVGCDKLIKWFAQNCIMAHPKLCPIPIGMDYHTLSISDHAIWGNKTSPIQQEKRLFDSFPSPSPSQHAMVSGQEREQGRMNKIFINVQFKMDRWNDRKSAINVLGTSPELIKQCRLVYQPTPMNRDKVWDEMRKYKYVLSPFGNGFDCHRTWEAILLGCIPIIRIKVGVDGMTTHGDLFSGLPVLIVNEWSDVTATLLDTFVPSHQSRHKLTLKYWTNLIASAQPLSH